MNHSFPKSSRLLKRNEFIDVHKNKTCVVGKYLKIAVTKQPKKSLKLGITASKFFGCAVIRNHFKRKVREAFRLSKDQLPNNRHIIVYPRKEAQKASMHEIQKELIELLSGEQSHIQRRTKKSNTND